MLHYLDVYTRSKYGGDWKAMKTEKLNPGDAKDRMGNKY